MNETIFGKIGAAFVRRWRITLLLLVAILVLGVSAYQAYLPREGFPSIQFPLSSVQVIYFTQDPKAFDEQIIQPINDALEGEEYIEATITSTDGNFGNIIIQLDTDLESEAGTKLIEDKVTEEVQLPEGAQIFFSEVNIDSVDGQNDLLFSFYSEEKTDKEIQAAANELALQLEGVEGITEVNVKEIYVDRFDPATGESFESKESYTKIGVKNGGDELEFYPAVNIGVVADESLTTIEISELVQQEVDKIMEKDAFESFQVEFNGDLGVTINEQITSLEENFIMGMIAVAIILILFVNWRASIVAVIFIPTVLAATFITMGVLGLTLNVISLFALVLALGLLVDDAIVVIEAIDRNKREGYEGIEAVKKSLNEIGAADVLGTLTTVLVFAPMLFISGVLGDFIKELPQTIIIALIWSLIIALTIVPVLTNWLVKYPKNGSQSLWNRFNRIVDTPSRLVYKFGEKVSLFTDLTLRNKVVGAFVAILSILFIGIGLSFAGVLFTERFNPFPPVDDADFLSVSATFAEATTIDEAESVSEEIEAYLGDEYEDEIVRYDYFVADSRNIIGTVVLIDMANREITASEISEDLTEQFSEVEEAEVRFDVQGAGPPTGDYPFQVQVFAEDDETLTQLTNEIKEYLEEIEVGDGDGVTEVVIVNLNDVARRDGERFAEVKAKITDPDNTQLVLDLQNEVKAEFDAEYLDENYGLDEDAIGYDLGQQSENLESFESLGFISVAAILLMYILLVWQFNSFTQPFLIIFLALFLAMPGVFLGLYFTDNFMSFLTAIGLIGLVGIVVNNTIMLVDFANQYRRETDSASKAMVNAIRVRFRPLVTTTVTTIVGLLPLALNDPFWEPISYTIIFGLISSTTLVILAFPIYYVALEWSTSSLTRLVKREK